MAYLTILSFANQNTIVNTSYRYNANTKLIKIDKCSNVAPNSKIRILLYLEHPNNPSDVHATTTIKCTV